MAGSGSQQRWSRFPAPDNRTGLGYGQTQNKYHKPRTSASTYPYVEEDPYDPEEVMDDIDMDLDDFVELQAKIRRVAYKNDPYSIKGTNPFYFAGAATKMSEVSLNVQNPTQAIDQFRSDVWPGTSWPGTVGSSTSGFKTKTRPTGTKRGWSAAPDVLSDEDEKPRYRLEDFADDDEDGEIILRQFIRAAIINK
jgi:hypothetical protein